MLRSLFVLMLCLVAASPALAGSKAPKPSKKRTFTLAYTPTEMAASGTSPCGGAGGPVSIGTFTDGRADQSRLGLNREKEKAPSPVVGEGDVGAFVAGALATEMKNAACEIAASGGRRVLTGEVTALSVDLEGTYKAQIALRVKVLDAAGKELVVIPAQGTSTRFSMLESPENYLETLGDAVFEALHAVMDDEAFRKALAP